VTTAGSVACALEGLNKGDYFCVLTDIAMPDMDGYEFVSCIKERHVASQVILMTGFGYNPNHTLIKINRSLRYPCLFKPFDRAKVSEVVLKAWQAYHTKDRPSPASPLPH
jgi:DNA-binding NtrC family response regulator